MSNWAKNKQLAVYFNTQPSATDQSQARETDINVIVGKMIRTGQGPNTNAQPIYADFTTLPEDLRGMIEQSRSIQARRAQLPDKLREMPIEQLLTLTADDLTNILTPPQPEVKKDESK